LESIRFGFAAAHFLPALPTSHKCRRMHGHSFMARVTVAESPGHRHALLDCLASAFAELDHALLNEIPGLENPTSEHLSRWLWERCHSREMPISEVRISETCATACLYRGE
jgi:6-pyruvoyltetrahydropterin/6-carboxytetrahydropterin synthase